MDRKVLLISQGSTFMVNTIKKTLTDGKFEVLSVSPAVKELYDQKDFADVIVFYLGDYLQDVKDAVVYLQDYVREEEKALYLIGSPEDFETFYTLAPKVKVTKELVRPLNVKDLVAIIDDYIEDMTDEKRKKNILVVDDDGIFLRTVHDWLSGKYNVAMVSSAVNAITYLANHAPDLILLDYEMPITSGPKLLEMIKSENATQNTPVIFLTAKSDKMSVMTGLALKPEGYLLKTMSSAEIVKAVDAFFEKQK